jgi:uncharacterized protein
MGNTLISGTFSREQIAAAAGGIFEVFPDGLEFRVQHMTAEGERVAVEATSEGRHVSGKIYSNEYHFLFEFQGGKLLRLKEYMDTERITDVLCGGQRPPAVSQSNTSSIWPDGLIRRRHHDAATRITERGCPR